MPDFECPRIGGWLKNSFIDFPGTVATVLFFYGCNLRCPYCHNPDLVTAAGETVDFTEVLSFLEKRRGIIEGVVLSGGEPTIHTEALPRVAEKIRKKGFKIKLDTNGLHPEMIRRIAPDYCALDMKTVPCRYGELGYRGGDQEKLLAESIAQVKAMGASAEVRITVASPFIDDLVINEFTRLLAGVHSIYLQTFVYNGHHIDNDIASRCYVDVEKIRKFQAELTKVSEKCEIRKAS